MLWFVEVHYSNLWLKTSDVGAYSTSSLKVLNQSQLARLRGKWSHLRDNSFPSALAPSKHYECIFNSLVTVTKRIPVKSSFCFSSKNCYSELLKDTTSLPVLPYRCSNNLGYSLFLSTHWSLVRDSLTENFNNDPVWLITLRAVKVRNSLKSWGYSVSDLCADCDRKEYKSLFFELC